MSVLEGVLREEISRLENNILSYEKLLLSLPKGSIFVRKMNNSSFVYRRRREKNKIISEYLGSLFSENARLEIEKSNEYKRIKNNLAQAKKELMKLRKAIKVYE